MLIYISYDSDSVSWRSQKLGLKIQKRKTWKLRRAKIVSSFRNILNLIHINIPCWIGCISWSCRACGICMGEYWYSYTNLNFLLLQLSVFVIIKEKENSSISINMKIHCNNLLPSFRVRSSFSHRAFDIFLLVNIDWDTPISISCYSNSVSWWSQKK